MNPHCPPKHFKQNGPQVLKLRPAAYGDIYGTSRKLSDAPFT